MQLQKNVSVAGKYCTGIPIQISRGRTSSAELSYISHLMPGFKLFISLTQSKNNPKTKWPQKNITRKADLIKSKIVSSEVAIAISNDVKTMAKALGIPAF